VALVSKITQQRRIIIMAEKPLKPILRASINDYLKRVDNEKGVPRYTGGRGGKRSYKQGSTTDRIKSKLIRRYNQAKVNTSLFYNVGKGVTSGTIDKTLNKAGFNFKDYRDVAKVKGVLRKTVSGRRGSLSVSNVANQMTLGYATLAGMAVGAPKGVKRNVKARTGTKSRTKKGLYGATVGKVVGKVKTARHRSKFGTESTAQMRKRMQLEKQRKNAAARRRVNRTKMIASKTGAGIQATGLAKSYKFTAARKAALKKAQAASARKRSR
jgi:hypothetical protein